ncbi:transcription factor Pcc1-domain-containing protein, partial [Lineolata rhizophorae]
PPASTLTIPFPTARLASTAERALAVDAELSPLVRRSFSLGGIHGGGDDETVLKVEYAATTNRMLRVAVNGFFESLGVVLGVMEELDVDVVGLPGKESVAGAQGVAPIAEGERAV